MIEVESEQMRECASNHGYDFEKVIGFGSESSVSLCKSKNCHHEFAIKRSSKQISEEEYKTLITYNHPNIISLYEVFNDEDYQYIVMDYCSKGTLEKLGKVSNENFVTYAKQMLQAIEYCHENHITNLNLMPKNILVDQYNHIKLCSFGNKEEKSNLEHLKRKEMIFKAPEVLQHKKFDEQQADIWSLGITFYYMAVGSYPFIKQTRDETKKAIVYSEFNFENQKIEPQIRFLISKMITKNSFARPSVRKLLRFPLFSNNNLNHKLNLLSASGRRNSLTGINIPSFIISDKNNDIEKENQMTDVHCYQSVAVHPSMQRIHIHPTILVSKPN